MEKELVLKTMREAGKPIAAGEVATLSGLDRKVVDKVFAELKKTGEIVSPVGVNGLQQSKNKGYFIKTTVIAGSPTE